ncbi:hypothetical protein NGB36_13040 [Streptomyces sp. RB6PN25]|uniref:Small hydrophilic protein n=1 Tax=Streptomyces humicola TaxID=2953240 RepID=A0ABT1PUZ8_9ACTN|nr:hypothetical protein [Streptomyces humicola]MCQ4081501.1 hypothetical protein [Streptomyces humicola]
MAKNKNQKQERRQQQPIENRSAEMRGQEQVKAASAEPQQDVLSADAPNMSRKKQKRLGHN